MVLVWAGLGVAGRRASGELFILQSGGKVSGQLVPQDPPDKDNLTIKTDSGATITLARSQIKQTLHQRPEEVEYEKLRVRAADTVQGQWELAEWCRENHLVAQREKHLKRIIELDPDHQQARLALGYERHGDTWTTQEELMTKQGYRRYKGRWRLPQEIEIMEKERQKELAEKEWMQKIGAWRNWLGTARDQQARDKLMAIKDDAAIKGLAEALKNDSRDEARQVFIDALAHVGTTPALMALTAWTMQEHVQDLCLSCLEHLRKAKCHDAVVFFVDKLRSKDNTQVNRAGMAPGRAGRPHGRRSADRQPDHDPQVQDRHEQPGPDEHDLRQRAGRLRARRAVGRRRTQDHLPPTLQRFGPRRPGPADRRRFRLQRRPVEGLVRHPAPARHDQRTAGNRITPNHLD